MELILISDSKLKIMLSESDLESYSLTSERLDYENVDTREAFKCILDEAKVKTGFDTECGRLFIKVFPSKNGGCEVYVTKGAVEKEKTAQKKAQNIKKEYCVFRLDDIDRACLACNSLMQMRYVGESSLYFEKRSGGRGVYYLVLQQEGRGASQQKKKRLPERCDVVSEFGTKMADNTTYFYIREHCEQIIEEQAVEKLCSLV